MWYELRLGIMRRVLLLVFLLLMPAVWAEESEPWVVEVEDQFGNPISNCEVVLKEPWTGAVIDNPGKGMYQASATCDGYVVMWHPPVPSSQTTIVLQAHSIIEDLFSVEGAHTMQVLGSDWEVPVSDGPIDAPSGVPVILIGEGGSVTRNSQSSITIPNGTSTYSLVANYSEEITVKAIHTGTGKMVEWTDYNLTIGEYGGGWTARVYDDGYPIGESIWPPTTEWVFEQLNSTKIQGNSSLNFISDLGPNENISGTWFAHHVFNNGLGLPYIPGVSAGIESQVDRFLGGDVAELNDLLESISYYNGKNALCCLVDNSEVKFTSVAIAADVDFSTGYWGWDESAVISGERSSINLMRIEVPFQNDIRQSTPLTVSTNGEWQYASSPLNEWINGTPDNFTLQRDETSISGFYTITLGQNNPPLVYIEEAYALPWDNTSYDFKVLIEDAPLSIHNCEWNISGINTNIGINLSSFEVDSLLPVSVTCEDEGGLNDSYSTTLVLDGGSPYLNTSEDTKEINPGHFNFSLDIGDDHDQNLEVYWTSNKTDGWWYSGKQLHTSFSVDSTLNSINDNITERHKQRNQVEYWLSAEVSDDVGHVTSGNWTIRLLDKTGPVMIANFETIDEDGKWKESALVSRYGDNLRLNLTESFDDHSSIDKINFSIQFLGIEYSDLSWSDVQYWELPELGVGYHEINVVGMDEAGNLAGQTFGVAIAPPIARNLEIIDISSASADIKPGENQFWVTVQNNGASTTEFTLRSGDVRVDSFVGPSSFSKNATVIVSMKVDMDWFETFSVELSYLDDANETVVKHSTSDYNSGIAFGGLELFIFVALGVLTIAWARSRKEPRF